MVAARGHLGNPGPGPRPRAGKSRGERPRPPGDTNGAAAAGAPLAAPARPNGNRAALALTDWPDAAAPIRGLDGMESQGVRQVTLSLAGPDNAALAPVAARQVGERDMVLVAAAGDGGPDRAMG